MSVMSALNEMFNYKTVSFFERLSQIEHEYPDTLNDDVGLVVSETSERPAEPVFPKMPTPNMTSSQHDMPTQPAPPIHALWGWAAGEPVNQSMAYTEADADEPYSETLAIMLGIGDENDRILAAQQAAGNVECDAPDDPSFDSVPNGQMSPGCSAGVDEAFCPTPSVLLLDEELLIRLRDERPHSSQTVPQAYDDDEADDSIDV